MTRIRTAASEADMFSGRLDVSAELGSLANHLELMQAAGYDAYETRETHVRGVLALVINAHDQEVVQKRDALWAGITSSVSMSGPYSVNYSSKYAFSSLSAAWNFGLFQTPSFEPEASRLSDTDPERTVRGMKVKASVPSYKSDANFRKEVDTALTYAETEPVFPARKVPPAILGLEAAKIARNKFRFNRSALDIRVGEEILDRAQSLWVTLYATAESSERTAEITSGAFERHDAIGIDDTASYLRLQPQDVAYSSEDMFYDICDYLREQQAKTPQDSFGVLYDKYVAPDREKLAFPRLVHDWLRQPLVEPVTADQSAFSTGR